MEINKYNKRAISGAVATVLFLLITVVAWNAFYFWYNDYTYNVFKTYGDVDDSQVEFEALDENRLYVRSYASDDFFYTSVRVDDVECDVNGTIDANSVTVVNLKGCLLDVDVGVKDIVLFSEYGIYDDKEELKVALDNLFIVDFKLGSICDMNSKKYYGLEFLNDTHVEISSSNLYTYSLCLEHVIYDISDDCNGVYDTIFYLDNSTNAHIFTDNSTPYEPIFTWNEICLSANDGFASNVDVIYSSSDMTAFNYSCIGSVEIDNVYGGHAGDCQGFSNKIWAKIE